MKAEEIQIPSDLIGKSNKEIMSDHLFQILNPDFRLPPELCRHVYQVCWVEYEQQGAAFVPLDSIPAMRTARQCKNCKRYL